MNQEIYNKFIDYIFINCDKMCFKYYTSAYPIREQIILKNINKIIELKNFSSIESIEEISEKFKNNFNIFDKTYLNNEKKIKKESSFLLRKLYFFHLFDNYEPNLKKNFATNKILNLAKKKNSNFNFSNSKEEILKLFEEFKDCSKIFNKKYKNIYEKNLTFSKKEKELQRKEMIQSCLYRYLYDNHTKLIINQNKNSLFYLKKENGNANYNIISYYFNLNEKIIDCLKKKQIIPNWQYPETFEDIAFFKKNGLCWMWSTSHEEMYEICFQENDRNEYEYLKSIGVEFVEPEFVATPKNYLHYLKDYIND